MADNGISQSQIAEFYAAVSARFSLARTAMGGIQSRTYCIADLTVRFDFAGNSLIVPLTRALAHLRLDSDARADLTIHIWDIAETGVAPPPPAWSVESYLRRGEITGYNDGIYHTVFHPDGRILFLYHTPSRTGYVAAFNHSTLPAYERAASLRPILAVALAAWNTQYVHAAAVGFPNGGVLIVGLGGAGKSTTALSSLDSDLLYAADDYCAVNISSSTPQVHSLYNTAKAGQATVERLPFLKPMIDFWDIGGSDKAILFLAESHPGKLIRNFPLRAILIPHITGLPPTELTPASSRAALIALAPSTISQLANADGEVFQRLATLVRQVPSFHLHLGTELSLIPTTIISLLERLQAQS